MKFYIISLKLTQAQLKINIAGNTRTVDKVIRREVELAEGDPYNQYSLKYNEGDTLALDISGKWSIDGFDAVIGNPPYNSSGNVGTGNTIWQHFRDLF